MASITDWLDYTPRGTGARTCGLNPRGWCGTHASRPRKRFQGAASIVRTGHSPCPPSAGARSPAPQRACHGSAVHAFPRAAPAARSQTPAPRCAGPCRSHCLDAARTLQEPRGHQEPTRARVERSRRQEVHQPPVRQRAPRHESGCTIELQQGKRLEMLRACACTSREAA